MEMKKRNRLGNDDQRGELLTLDQDSKYIPFFIFRNSYADAKQYKSIAFTKNNIHIHFYLFLPIKFQKEVVMWYFTFNRQY